MDFKQRIERLATELGLSVNSFSKAVSVSNSYVNNTHKASPMFLKKIKETFPQVNTDWVAYERGSMFKNDNGKSDCIERIPLLPVMMDGKRIEDYEMDNSLASENVVPPVPNVTHASTIIGDSMSPEYLNGSRIFLSKIDFRKFIEWGRTYEIETSNGVIVKNVFPCKSEESKIVCRSINNNYSDFEVDIDDVISMYRVIAVLTLK